MDGNSQETILRCYRPRPTAHGRRFVFRDTELLLDILLLFLSLCLILLAAAMFTNGIEMLGHRLKVHQGAVGSVLAAVGTAMPETIIPIIAIVLAALAGQDTAKAAANHGFAIGGIVGAPLMLSTLAMLVTGLAVLVYAWRGKRPLAMTPDLPALRRDLTYFLIIYVVGILVSAAPHAVNLICGTDCPGLLLPLHIGAAVFLMAGYVYYLKRTFAGDSPQLDEPADLYLAKWLRINLSTAKGAMVQLLLSLAIMIFAAEMFVGYMTDVATQLNVSVLVLSLILTPIATELPEKFNSIIWIGHRKDALAMGNITGALVFQGSFPVMFGILFTGWDLFSDHHAALVAAVMPLGAAAAILLWVKLRNSLSPYLLIVLGLLYGLFVLHVAFL